MSAEIWQRREEERLKEKRMSESKNPYKYMDCVIVKGTMTTFGVVGVIGDLVGEYVADSRNVRWYHWDDLSLVMPPTSKNSWVDITKDNWMEYRDRLVWVSDGDLENEPSQVRKLVDFDPKYGNFPAIAVEKDGDSDIWRHASILNEAGEPATWEES